MLKLNHKYLIWSITHDYKMVMLETCNKYSLYAFQFNSKLIYWQHKTNSLLNLCFIITGLKLIFIFIFNYWFIYNVFIFLTILQHILNLTYIWPYIWVHNHSFTSGSQFSNCRWAHYCFGGHISQISYALHCWWLLICSDDKFDSYDK